MVNPFGPRSERHYDHEAVECFPWPVVVGYQLREILARDCSVKEQFKLWQTATKGPESRAIFFRCKKMIGADTVD